MHSVPIHHCTKVKLNFCRMSDGIYWTEKWRGKAVGHVCDTLAKRRALF